MSAPDEAYYSEERWENWLDRLREEPPDPEDEESARLLLNLQNDVAIAVAKILRDYDEGELDVEAAIEELEEIHEVVLADPDIDNEETVMLIDGVQTSLVCVFYSAEQYLADGVADEADIDGYVEAAAEAEAAEEFDRALGLIACAGTRVIGSQLGESDDELDMAITEDLEYGLVTEWINGLDSLNTQLTDPEVVEEPED